MFGSSSLGALPASQFHGRAQPGNLERFFERALGLVKEVTRLLSTAENKEDALEFCIERLENLLTNSVNLFQLIDEKQYGDTIDGTQLFIFLLRSRVSHTWTYRYTLSEELT